MDQSTRKEIESVIKAHYNGYHFVDPEGEACSRHLSKWFTWNMERSYPQGRTDLEFIGKFNEKFAGLRIVIEFKYYSNTATKKMKAPVDNFKAKKKDTDQLKKYVANIKELWPESTIESYLIYCFGNQGFRVF